MTRVLERERSAYGSGCGEQGLHAGVVQHEGGSSAEGRGHAALFSAAEGNREVREGTDRESQHHRVRFAGKVLSER